MKLLIFSVLLVNVLTLKMERAKSKGYGYTYTSPYYYSYTPINYSYTPSSYYYSSQMNNPGSYSYNPYNSYSSLDPYEYTNSMNYNPYSMNYNPYYSSYSPYSSYSSSYSPYYVFGYRRGPPQEQDKQMAPQGQAPPQMRNPPSTPQLKEQLKTLKTEIWGNPDFSTEEIRKDNKAYDIKWLIAQLKITRALELEDTIANKQKEREEGVDRISISSE